MNKMLFGAAIAALTAVATPASAVALTFDDIGTGLLTNQYAAQGVTFSSAVVDNYGALPGATAPNVVRSTAGTTFGPAQAVRASFAGVTQIVSFTAIDLGEAGIRIDGFDANGNFLGFSEAYGTGNGIDQFAQVALSLANIASVAIYQPNVAGQAIDGVAIDNFSFRLSAPAVPEPATWAMMLTGFGLVGGALRRREKAALTA